MYYWIAYLLLVEEMTFVGTSGTTEFTVFSVGITAALMCGVGGFVCGTRRTGWPTHLSRSVLILNESRRHVHVTEITCLLSEGRFLCQC